MRDETPGVSPVLPLLTSAPNGASVQQLDVYRAHGQPLLMPYPVTQGYLYLMGRIGDGSLPLQVMGASYAVSYIHDRAHITVRLTRTAVEAIVHVTAKGEIAESPAGSKITRATDVQVGSALASAILRRSLLAIAWANKTHTDPFGYAKRAAWLDPSMAANIPEDRLTTLPIHATIVVRGIIQGEGVAR